MAAMDFPSSPTNGQVYGNYVYSTSKGAWQARPVTSEVAVISPTAPSNPKAGDIWYNSDDGCTYVYYYDGDSYQWVASRNDATFSSTLGPRLTNLEMASPVVVASAAARNAAFPTPAQGNSVFRSDTGWVETYYALYNASTNPGGTTPAGWYPTSGNMPQAKLVRNTSALSFSSNAWNSVPNLTYWDTEIPAFGGVTIESNGTLKTSLPGIYEANVGIMSNGIAFTILTMKKNATSADGTGQIAGNTGFGQSGWNVTNAKTNIKLAANDYIFWAYYATTSTSSMAWSNGVEKNGSFLQLRYVGPPLGA